MIDTAIVWYVFPSIVGMTAHTAYLCSELWAVLGEAFLYVAAAVITRPLRAVGTAALANGLSLGVGVFFT